jgi:hypothetical protein
LLRLEEDKLNAAAADQDTQKIRDYYRNVYPDEDGGYFLRREGDHGASTTIHAVCDSVWKMTL